MRTNIANVIRAFQNHQTCNEKTCSTDGERIYICTPTRKTILRRMTEIDFDFLWS